MLPAGILAKLPAELAYMGQSALHNRNSVYARTKSGDIVKMTRRVRIAILSESRLFREAVSSCLAAEPEVEVVGQANTIHELLLRARGRPIEVLLVCAGIGPVRFLEALWDVKTLLPASRVVLLGCEQDNPHITRWIEANTMAWLGQDASYGSVLEAIAALSEGRRYAGRHQPKVNRNTDHSAANLASTQWHRRLAGVTQHTATRSLTSHRRDAGAT